MDDYGDFEAEEFEQRPEAKAFERAGPTSKLAEVLDMPLDEGKVKSVDQRFFETVNRVGLQMIDVELEDITHNDINIMLEVGKNKLPGIKFKNPIGYVFGYIASQGGRKLVPKHIKKTIFGKEREKNEIKDLRTALFKEGGLTPPDIIKYSRLWMMLQ